MLNVQFEFLQLRRQTEASAQKVAHQLHLQFLWPPRLEDNQWPQELDNKQHKNAIYEKKLNMNIKLHGN